DDPTFLLLLDVPHNSNEPTTSLVITFHIHLKERAGSFEVRAYEFLPNLDNSNGGSAFGLIPIVLQVGEERLVKDFKKFLIKNKIFDVEVEENEDDNIGNGSTEKSDKKMMNTTQMRVQAPRLGCLGECGHLCLIPLNNVVWENNIDDAAIYDDTLPETKYRTVLSCFPLKDFPIPDSTGVKLMKKSSNINDTGNVEWGSVLVGRKGLSVVMIENPSDKCNVNIREQDTQILAQHCGDILMATWANMPLDAMDGSHSTIYIVAVDQDGMRDLNFQSDFLSSLTLTGTRGNKKECENVRAIFVTSHITDVCTQGNDIIIVAGNKETTLYIGK
ncbi:7545_t:CDS:2, partial [Racocetra fulgida]